VYQTYAPEQIQYLLSDAESKVVITEEAYAGKVNAIRDELPSLAHVISVDSRDGDHSLDELMEMDPDFDPAESVEQVGLDDLLTLIYTSGTTGPPKGVQLTHRNLLFAVATADELIELPERGGKVISWLPAAHVAERNAHYYLPVTKGISVTVCSDPRRIAEFLPKVNPTWFFAVPRIFEKLKSGLEAMLAGLPDEQRVPAQKGLEASLAKVRAEQAGEEVPPEIAEAAAQADEQMFSQLRKQLGLDEALAVNAGAAPTPLEVLEFFHAIGIPVGELWGMSETCGLGTINPPDRIKLGTVGPPTPGVEIRLDDDGEVLVKADCVMPGYRKLPDKNEEAFTEDGWLRTGDIGEIDQDGYLKIVDRKKEIIINAAGKNMSPANIESHLKTASPLVGQAVTIGNGRPYNVALIVLDPDFAPVWASQNGLDGKSVEELAGEEKARDAIQAAVDQANEKMARVEQIKKFEILPEQWEPGGDELTPTMKLKRKPIDEKYAEEIEALYSR
jgi:long-chain acyl-CoA synthetase